MYNFLGDYVLKFIFLLFTVLFSSISFFSSNSDNLENLYIYPTDITSISSSFGYRDLFGKNNFHDGVDFLAPQGSYVYSTMSGVVVLSKFINGYGNCVTILHDNGYKSLYAHLSEEFLVTSGEYVKQGDIIGKVGPKYLSNGILNGNTTGPHLHFSIIAENGKFVNPLTLNLQEKRSTK